ncbi:MAG: chromate efflux transporter [Pseudomonadota bacterium]
MGEAASRRSGAAVREVFAAFLRLGLTSFGGPIAHIAYFRHEFVERRAWLDEADFAQLLALCHFLPGPSSSQLGFALGLRRAGWGGALAAFVAFTLPSAFMLVAFAGVAGYLDSPLGQAALHGLKLAALAVVAHAVVSMTRQFCTDKSRILLAAGASAIVLGLGQAWAQPAVIALGGALGILLLTPSSGSGHGARIASPHGALAGGVFLLAFVALLMASFWLVGERPGLASVAASFFQAGALVFGGGHVVLPLLNEAVVTPGWLAQETFLAGYGAAQAIPGPLFALAAYLGASMPAEMGGATGASVALIAIFLPGFLLLAGVLPFWSALSARAWVLRGLSGINAAVVGILAAALYQPLWTGAVANRADIFIVLLGWLMLARWRVTPLIVVAWCVSAAAGVSALAA